MRILRRRTLERRLFFWLLGLALVPALLVLGVATWLGTGTLQFFGTLGPWTQVSSSGSRLLQSAEPAARRDTALQRASAEHRAELERSLTQAQRWRYLGERLLSILPAALIGFTLMLALAALLISRKLARELSRPIQELEDWTERIARAEPLPEPQPREHREVREVQALRQSLRRAATELEQARQRARQQERTRAWGELARRLAHEMKNPLTPLRLAAHRLRPAAQRDPSLYEPLRVVDEETGRLEQLAREFGMLGRPVDGPRSAVDLVELLKSLLATDVPASIQTRLTAPESTTTIADYNALQQALRNVLRNAVEAVQDRPDPLIEAQVLAQDGKATVIISDNGGGLDPAVLERVFEPDFTTKPRGTGLGLTIVRQTIDAHGGTVQIRNERAGAAVVIQMEAAP